MSEFIRRDLGQKLIDAALITQEQYEIGMKKHSENQVPLRNILVEMGFVTEENLMAFLGESIGMPFIRNLFNKITDPTVINFIPEKTCRQYMAMPLFKTGEVLTIAMGDPFDVFAIDDLQSIAKCKVEAVLSKKDEIVNVIDSYYGSKDPLHDIVSGMEKDEALEIIQDDDSRVVSEEQTEVVDAPIIRLVNTMISQAIKDRASDIHVEPEEKKLGIRYRIDGVLRETMVPPKRLQPAIISRIKIMAGMDISTKRTPQDGRFKIRVEKKDIDIRISTIPTIYGEKVVMRLLDQTSVCSNLEDIGFNKDTCKQFRDLIDRPYGIILVTGPTGSGKTTTLYYALQEINSPEKNIVTIEEPVEYELEGINQISVNVKAGVTFAEGLKSILRQDPDVIMVGEVRDLETANIAVRAALTGHLVFSTLHTNDAASSIARLIDMGVPPYLVTSSVSCILAQRLVRKVCEKCKEPFTPTPEMLSELDLDGTAEGYTFYKGKGCEDCAQTGYFGRIGVFEFMVIDKELRNLIHTGCSGDDIKVAAQKTGMKLLWEDGKEKIKKGVTTIEELKRVTFMEEA